MMRTNLRNVLGPRTGNPVAWVLMLGSGLLIAFAPFPNLNQSSPQTRMIRIEASQFAYAPAEIHVNPGDHVTIELVSTDVVHGLYLDNYDLSVQSDPGHPDSLSFTADKSGSFRFRCNITCGGLHPFMIGKLTVGENQWRYRGLGLALLIVLGTMILSDDWDRFNPISNMTSSQK